MLWVIYSVKTSRQLIMVKLLCLSIVGRCYWCHDKVYGNFSSCWRINVCLPQKLFFYLNGIIKLLTRHRTVNHSIKVRDALSLMKVLKHKNEKFEAAWNRLKLFRLIMNFDIHHKCFYIHLKRFYTHHKGFYIHHKCFCIHHRCFYIHHKCF